MDKQSWLMRNITPLLILLLVIAITSGIFFFYQNFPDRFDELKHYGYLGVFLISLLLNATVILPVGNFIILFTLGGILPLPIVVGLAGGAGAAIGEITGYMAGYSGHGIVEKSRLYNRMEGWVTKWGAAAIFIFSLFPFAFDLVGIAAGVLRFPFRKFLLFCWFGRTILYIIIALAGAWGWEAILPYLG
ncbi:hypothetical protein ES708_00578 [subsurface metagenome]